MASIKMTMTVPGSMDGINSALYIKDQEYQIDDNQINQRLADIFIAGNMAVLKRTRSVPPVDPNISPSEGTKNPEPSEIKVDDKIPEEIETDDNKEPEPKNTRVFALAKELNVNWQEIIEIANKLGIEVHVAQAGLTDSEVQKIKDEV